MKKSYSTPELEINKLFFENLLDIVIDSQPEGSGWDTDDEREE